MQQQLAHYQIEDLLGEGSFASVYRAFDQKFERDVALKILKPVWLSDPQAVDRFKREAKTMAKLRHPHIVDVFDVGEGEGSIYLAQLLVEGETLTARLKRGPLAWPEMLSILQALAAALDYAHEQGVVHRDIKPSNILLDEAGQAYLGDFGLVRAAEGSVALSTTSGGMIGTPAYMAPEQWEGKPVSAATDVYALSCVVVEMLTGKLLFDGSTPPVVMRQHLIEGPQFPDEWPVRVPRGVNRVLRRGLAQSAADRLNKAGELSTALAALSTPPPPGPSMEIEEDEVPTKPRPSRKPEATPPPVSPPTPTRRRASQGLTTILVGCSLVLVLIVLGMVIAFMIWGGQLASPEEGAPIEGVQVTQEVKVEPEVTEEIEQPATEEVQITEEVTVELEGTEEIEQAATEEVEEAADSEVGSLDKPIKILFTPLVVDADIILHGGEVMAQVLNEATGLHFQVAEVPSNYAATVEAICNSPEDTIAFIPSLGYVVANNRCGAEAGAAAERFGYSWFTFQILVPRESNISSLEDLAGKTWGVPDLLSTTGYLYPAVLLKQHNIEPGQIVEVGGHTQSVLAVYSGDVAFSTSFFVPPQTDPPWQFGNDPEPYDVYTVARDENGQCFSHEGVRVLDARCSAAGSAPDVFAQIRILTVGPKIPNDAVSFSRDFPEALRDVVITALIEFTISEACQESICASDFYGVSGFELVNDSAYDPARELIEVLGYTEKDIFGN